MSACIFSMEMHFDVHIISFHIIRENSQTYVLLSRIQFERVEKKSIKSISLNN